MICPYCEILLNNTKNVWLINEIKWMNLKYFCGIKTEKRSTYCMILVIENYRNENSYIAKIRSVFSRKMREERGQDYQEVQRILWRR